MEMVNPEHLAALCPELRTFLNAELAVGNRVVETSMGWPKPQSVFIMLAEPFKAKPAAIPGNIIFNDVNDSHWWKADYYHEASGHVLACRTL
jgi:hypothetical protein